MVMDRLSHTGGAILRVYGRAVYPWAKLATAPVIKRLFDVRVDGEDRVPRFGPAIITPNHLSFIDPFFVALMMTRRMTFIGKAEYWDSWKTRWFFELGGGIPVRRDDSIMAQGSLEAGQRLLERGELLGIFPEGTRSPDGRLYKGKTGAARMALEVGCPIVPTGLQGTQRVLPKDATVPRFARVTVKFGKPRLVPEEAREDAHFLRVFTDDLMCEIASLSGQEYRDRYAYQKRRGTVPAPAPAAPFT
jgi:1-acyl-sn-glycerol-3-phosphate acyltransferase